LPRVAIVDYGLGNLRSVQKALENVGAEVRITNSPAALDQVDGIVLPGVGAFRDAIRNIRPFESTLKENVDTGTPLLGICLGLQLLFTESTEGGAFAGLDIFQGRVVRLPATVKIPHMGWNRLQIVDRDAFMTQDVPNGAYVYFVHSYYAEVEAKSIVKAYTEYGVTIPAIVAENNVVATQFHPEKSGATGLKLLANYVRLLAR
jgi:glutamine amidotransferase